MLAARIADRMLTFDASSAVRTLGIVERPLDVPRMMGGRSSAVYRLTFPSGSNRQDAKTPSWGSILDRAPGLAAWRLGGCSDLVLKHALASGSVLALGARLAGPQPYPSDLSPGAR